MPCGVSRRREEPDSRQHLRLPVVLDVARAVEVDPLVHVGVSGDAVRELTRLHVDRRPREAPVAAAVVEMQVRVDHERDAVDQLFGERARHGREGLVELGPRVDHPGVDEHEALCMLDRMDVHREHAAEGLDLGREVRLDHPRHSRTLAAWPQPPRSARF